VPLWLFFPVYPGWVSGVSPAAGQKNGRSNRKRKLISDRINQASLKSFALAGEMDGINILNQKKILIIL
jgi:hypothetical protein